MKNELITNIEQGMIAFLDNSQMKRLKEVLKMLSLMYQLQLKKK